MRIFIVSLLLLLTSSTAKSQVEWHFSSKKIADQTYEIHLTAIVDNPWHIYSQQSPKKGSFPTSIQFTKNPLVTLVGETREIGEMQTHFEEIFNTDVYFYIDSVHFVQKIKVKGNAATTISGSIEYMVCTEDQCLPPKKQSFSIKLN